MSNAKKHWTEESTKTFLYAIAHDFMGNIEERMKERGLKQSELAQAIGVTEGRVSQILNNPGNLTLELIVKCARALGLKASVLAYDDGDPLNTNGPINSKVFVTCWEKQDRPKDFWAFEVDLSECVADRLLPSYIDKATLIHDRRNKAGHRVCKYDYRNEYPTSISKDSDRINNENKIDIEEKILIPA